MQLRATYGSLSCEGGAEKTPQRQVVTCKEEEVWELRSLISLPVASVTVCCWQQAKLTW